MGVTLMYQVDSNQWRRYNFVLNFFVFEILFEV